MERVRRAMCVAVAAGATAFAVAYVRLADELPGDRLRAAEGWALLFAVVALLAWAICERACQSYRQSPKAFLASVGLVATVTAVLGGFSLWQCRAACRPAPDRAAALRGLPPPAPYAVAGIEDVSLPGRSRAALRVIVLDERADMSKVHATLLHAATREVSADAVMVFGYWPGDDTSGAYTAGHLQWGRDGTGWTADDRFGPRGKFEPGASPADAADWSSQRGGS